MKYCESIFTKRGEINNLVMLLILMWVVIMIFIGLVFHAKALVEECDVLDDGVNCSYSKCKWDIYQSRDNKGNYMDCLNIKSMEKMVCG